MTRRRRFASKSKPPTKAELQRGIDQLIGRNAELERDNDVLRRSLTSTQAELTRVANLGFYADNLRKLSDDIYALAPSIQALRSAMFGGD